jgi:hypothetical protein
MYMCENRIECVEVTECKLYMRVDDTKNYKRDNPVSMTRRIQNTESRTKNYIDGFYKKITQTG